VRQAAIFTAEIVPAARAWAAEPVDIDALYHLLDHRPSWQADAACREAPAGVNFFPIDIGEGDAARAMCGRCVVADDCGSWASAQDPDLLKGIWGGLDERERRQVARRR
jgi:WhiB family redox-sensing transcriptional regulator